MVMVVGVRDDPDYPVVLMVFGVVPHPEEARFVWLRDEPDYKEGGNRWQHY